MVYSNNLPLSLLITVSIVVSQYVFVEAGWRRPLSTTSYYYISSLPSLLSNQHNEQYLLQPSTSIFGVGKVDIANREQSQRRRYLSSIITSSIRGGDIADDDVSNQQQLEDDIPLERNIKVNKATKKKEIDNNDDERYSRQMYALGARAHKLVRSTTAILDGPLGGRLLPHSSNDNVEVDGADGFDGLKSSSDQSKSTISVKKSVNDKSRSEIPSGLVYEIAKNLALSGVGRIILVQDDNDNDISATENKNYNDIGYFDGSLDDLGAAYHRAALAEVGGVDAAQGVKRKEGEEEEGNSDDSDDKQQHQITSLDNGGILLAEYIQRLNPGVQVDIVSRSKLLNLLNNNNSSDYVEDEEDRFDMEGNHIEESDDEEQDNSISLGTNPVVVCVDRSITSQLIMNDACRSKSQSSGGKVVPFISVETAGVQAKLFCDFGETFVVVDEDGETPRSTLLEGIEKFEDGQCNIYTIKCLEGERHDVSKGDVIDFQGEHIDDQMMTKVTFPKCQVVSVKSPTCFNVKEWDGETIAGSSSMKLLLEGKARSFSRVKLPKQVSFTSLRDILKSGDNDDNDQLTSMDCCDDDTLFAPSDLDKSFDPLRRRAVMTSMSVLDQYVTKYGRLPSRSSRSQERFQSLVRKMDIDDSITDTKQWDSLISQFISTCKAKFTPVQALSGALAAQEVLKAATGLYNPVKQFLLYDCDEVLQGTDDKAADETESSSSSTGQSYILGEHISKKLARSSIFLVGAGAIGCELLKNLAAMGAGTGASNTKRGSIILTDMDTIEKSNLSRQLLFRDHDVGEFKSVAARSAMMRFSPECQVEAHTSRVGEEEDGPFDDDFWSSGCNVVLNALDNVEARLFVDSQCVTHGLGLIDAGTLGPKGNVQVVVPHESESYGSSADPPEPDIPVCTLKNFPYEISHTIQWAKDLFEGYYHRRPRQANDHVEEMALTEELTVFGQLLIEKLGEDAAVDMAEELGEDLGPFPFIVGNADLKDPEYVAAVKKVSLDWAIEQAHKLFFVSMDELIQKHPIDSVDDNGAPFWSGTRKVPRPLRFVPLDSEEDEVSAQQVIINERIAQFVSAAARLRMETFLPTPSEKEPLVHSSLMPLEESLLALQEHANLINKKQKSKESVLHNLSGGGSDDTLSLILERLTGAKTGASFLPHLNLADFEKDDEGNGHVAFVTAASNLRAMAYGIPPADAMETRRVAGRIVPAMITTTGLVSALSCLELVKLLKGLPLMSHRNAFVNLALPFFAFTSPMPAEEVIGVNGKTHTCWDRISIKGSSNTPTQTMTLRKFLKKVQNKAGCDDGIEISSISYGPYMIYANFLHSDDEELLETPLIDTVRDAVISEDDEDDMIEFEGETAEGEKNLTAEQKAILSRLDQKRFIDFSVAVEDEETGEEYELPPVRLIKDKQAKPQSDEDIEDVEKYDIE